MLPLAPPWIPAPGDDCQVRFHPVAKPPKSFGEMLGKVY
jgi:hypothetical protein